MLFMELVCWAGLLFFFWTWKGRFGQVQPDSETQATPGCADEATRDKQADDIQILPNAEPIGRYRDMPIYGYVLIEGVLYRFNCVDVEASLKNPGRGKRCIPPGLIYEECRQSDMPPSD